MSALPNTALSTVETDELLTCEAVIERGLQTFIEVGGALLTIRDKRLYRDDYGTFEDYCEQRWQMSRPRAYQLMDAARVVENLSTMVDIVPASERLARPLVQLGPEAQIEAWAEALDTIPNGTALNSAHVERVASHYKMGNRVRFNGVICEVTSIASNGYLNIRPIVGSWRETVSPADVQPMGAFIHPTDAPRPPPERETDYDTGEITYADNGVDEPDYAPAPPSFHGMDIHYRSESKERYTPADFMAYVREMFADIDLDPASNAAANGVIRASRYYSREDDGLAQSWDAENIFLNPPYGDEIKPFIEKAVEEYQRGAFREAILLVPARTDTEWFGLLRVYPRCFVTGRMKFWNDEDPTLNSSAPFPSVVFYLGGRLRKFGQIFSEIGDVYVLWETE